MKNKTTPVKPKPADAITLARQDVQRLWETWESVCIAAVATKPSSADFPVLPFFSMREKSSADYDRTSLAEVCQFGDFPALENLIAQGCDIRAKDDWALRIAVMHGEIETVTRLLDLGADIHAKDDEALQTAVRQGYSKMVCLLLERGADVHARNDAALQTATLLYTEVSFLLVDYGAPMELLTPHKFKVKNIIQQRKMEHARATKKLAHTKETLTQVFQAATWAGHVGEMAALWEQIPKPLQTELDFSHALAQARIQTLKSSKPKVTIKK
jgi:hypothetical protein